MPRQDGEHDETGENSRPINGEDSTPAHRPDFKVRAQAAYQAPSRAIARELAAGVVADYGRKYESAVACFMDDFEACIGRIGGLSGRRIYLNAFLSRNAVVSRSSRMHSARGPS